MRRLGDTRLIPESLRVLARAAAANAQYAQAIQLSGAEELLRADLGIPLTPIPMRSQYEQNLAEWKAAVGEAAFAAAWAFGRASSVDRLVAESVAMSSPPAIASPGTLDAAVHDARVIPFALRSQRRRG